MSEKTSEEMRLGVRAGDDTHPSERETRAAGRDREAAEAAGGNPDGVDMAKSQWPESAAATGFVEKIRATLEMIKFQHTIFALPFALLGAVVAAGGWPEAGQLFWILSACVCARSAAMSFNRLHDEEFDRQNPRTEGWALPAGLLTRKFVWLFLVTMIALFVASAAMLNKLALVLSPIALAVLLGYSLTKRFTSGAHFVLGLALGIAPVGAWVAVRGELNWTPVVLGVGVMLWTSGFDMIYSLQDIDIDRKLGLHSMPSRLGRSRALAISALCHSLSIAAFGAMLLLTDLSTYYFIALVACAWLLVYEQSLVKPNDISKLPMAFFTLNGWVSVLIFAGGLVDILKAR